MWILLWKAISLGFSVAAPVGPIGVLCIKRTLTQGRNAGLASGLGAATADAIYGLVAGLGLTFLTSRLVAATDVLRLVGTAYLLYLGWHTFRSRPAAQAADLGARAALGAWASTFALTITNPMTILSFAAMFSALVSADDLRGSGAAWVLPAGVFLGSAAWWLVLSTSVHLLRSRIGPRQLGWVNRGAGALLLSFAAFSVIDWALRHGH